MKYYLLSFTMCLLTYIASAQDHNVFLSEDFNDLKAWEPLTFPKIAKHSQYTVISEGTNNVLKTASDASASGLIYKSTFDVNTYSKVKWRWKVLNTYTNGNAKAKEGDDYPLRVYIIFTYDPSEASFGLRTKYALAKAVYGEYPPHSSLNYIWANKNHEEKIITSPYTSRSIMIKLRSGAGETGKWVEENIDIVEDYKAAFGKSPPETASIAIMNDSDNTGEKAISYVDYIKVYK